MSMNDEMVARQAMDMSGKAMEAGSRVLEALIAAMGTASRNAEVSEVYGKFKQYIAEGGEMMGLPISQSRVEDFEKLAQEAGITYSIMFTKGDRETAVIQFMKKDDSALSLIVDSMLKQGEPLIKGTCVSVEELLNSVGEEGYDESTGFTQESVKDFVVAANSAGLKYALKSNEYNVGFTVLTSTADYNKFLGVAGFIGVATTHQSKREGMESVNDFLSIAKENTPEQSMAEKELGR